MQDKSREGDIVDTKSKTLFLRQEYDDDFGGDYRRYQELFEQDDDGNERIIYWVSNLDECPEDAIIDRSLFSAEEYVKAVEYGISLGLQGYSNIDLVEVM